MDFLNDIKVYDDVLDEKTTETMYQWLRGSFYVLARSNSEKQFEQTRKFLSQKRTPEEVEEFKQRMMREIANYTCEESMAIDDKYWTRIHKGAPECTHDDETFCKALYDSLSTIIDTLPPYEHLGNVYTNMLRFMDKPKAHFDNVDSRNRTVMFYMNDEWDYNWGGETVFYNFKKEIIKSVLPKPGRVVSFDGRIPHAARAPMTTAYQPRYITVMKF